MTRSALLVTHTGRRQSTQHARSVAQDLLAAGFEVRVIAEEVADLDLPPEVTTVQGPEAAEGAEIVLAMGGDGTFLRAAELARPVKAPLLGINLGKVGFLAEAEIDHIDEAVKDVVDNTYTVDERLTLDVRAEYEGRLYPPDMICTRHGISIARLRYRREKEGWQAIKGHPPNKTVLIARMLRVLDTQIAELEKADDMPIDKKTKMLAEQVKTLDALIEMGAAPRNVEPPTRKDMATLRAKLAKRLEQSER